MKLKAHSNNQRYYSTTSTLSQSNPRNLFHLHISQKSVPPTYYTVRVISAPFSEDRVGSMIINVVKFRALIEQNARLIDKQSIDEGLDLFFVVEL
jgi:hypothetical protein